MGAGDPTMWSNVLDKYAQIQATQTVPIAYTPTVIWGVAGTNLSVGSEVTCHYYVLSVYIYLA